MNKRKIGVIIESFRLGVKGGIKKAAELKVDGFQIYCTSGEMAPENMNAQARKDFRKFVADQGLVISALCADYGTGFLDVEKNPLAVKNTKACMDLAADLGTRIITTHIGKLPIDEKDPKWQAAKAALSELSLHGDKVGVAFATETGPESAEHLARLLKQIAGKSAKVNYDPANLCMYGFDQLIGVEQLKDYIVHTHAKDGMRGKLEEMPLGKGNVDFPKYIAQMDKIGYKGFYTIEREVGDNPVKDISMAVEFLQQL